jgi:MFS family permease
MGGILQVLRWREGSRLPAVVAASVLVLTSLTFFRVALLPEFGDELGMSAVRLGWVTTLFALGRLLADLPAGRIADSLPATRILVGAAMAAGGGSLVLGLAPSDWWVFVGAFLLGVSSSVTNATGMTYFSRIGGTEARGTAMSVYSAALLGGQAVGPALGGLVGAAFGWRSAFFGAAAVAVGFGAVLAAAGRSTPGADGGRANPVDQKLDVPRLGVMAALLLQAVPLVVFLTLGSIPQTLVPLIGAREVGLGTDVIGLALGIGGVCRFLGTLVGGRVADRIGRKPALVPALVVQGVGVGLLALPPSVTSWMVAIVLMSLASVAVAVAATVLGDLSPPDRVGTNLGRFRFFGDLGFILGPVMVTGIYETGGRAAASLLVAGLLVGVGAAAAWLLPETRRVR